MEYKGFYDDVHQENDELTLKNEVWIFNIRMCLMNISSICLVCINYDIHQRIRCGNIVLKFCCMKLSTKFVTDEMGVDDELYYQEAKN